jgi:hypothetical protein
MRRTLPLALFAPLALAALACAPAAPPATVAAAIEGFAAPALDQLAERYVRLALALGEHDGDYVDAYFGPSRWPEQAKEEALTLPTIRERGVALAGELATTPATDRDERQRRAYLARQTRALMARLDLLAGRALTFDEESRALFGVEAPRHDRAHFEAILAELGRELPGDAPLATRLAAYRAGFVIPPERLDRVFQEAIAACRARTVEHLPMPEGESFSVEYVTDQPWSGYNWYHGGYRSVIQVNTDLPIHIDRAVDLACHEGYPGHHAYNVLREQHLVNGRGWVEHTVVPLFAPQALVMEGTGNYGVEIAFPPEERLAYERSTLFPLAGLDPAGAERYYRVQALLQRLGYAGNEAARGYLDGAMTAEQAADWLERYALMEPERARQRLRFIDKYRSYVVNYNLGQDLVRQWVEAEAERAGGDDAARWRAFERLLREPLLPEDLAASGD